MTGADFVRTMVSPAGIMLAGQIATIIFMIAGLIFMVGLRRLATRLIIIAVAVILVPLVVSASYDEVQWLVGHTPRWALVPFLALAAAIVFCWVLWGIIALCFGPTIANSVITDILSWFIRGIIIAVVAPYRSLAALLRRGTARDPFD